MNKTQFFDYVSEPNLLNEETVNPLNEIIDEYPWFQTARVLLVKNLHILDHVKFNSELKTSAAFISDRKRLFELVHQKSSVEKEEKKEDQEAPKQIVKPAEKASPTKEDQTEQNKERQSSVKLSTNVSSFADYFQADDVYETGEGQRIDFSDASASHQEEENSIVLPSADFLEYESSDYSGYQLKEAVEHEEDDNRSFSGWLNVLRHAPVKKEEEKVDQPVKKKSQQLIDSFLTVETPRIRSTNDTGLKHDNDDRHQKSVDDADDLLSETLANIYIKQNHHDKAISIYEKLRLKYPEKNVYFAERIKELEKLINNK